MKRQLQGDLIMRHKLTFILLAAGGVGGAGVLPTG